MKRLFFLVPTLRTLRQINQELTVTRISADHIHVYGGSPILLQKAHIPAASILQTTDFVPALKRGAIIGIFLSAVLTIIYLLLLPENVQLNPFAMAALIFFGILFGSWTSSLIGVGINNTMVEKYSNYVNKGHYLMMIDSADDNESNIIYRVVNHHPQARIAGATAT